MKILVAGGAGCLGSNLVERLLREEQHVIILDTFQSNSQSTIVHQLSHKNLTVINRDVTDSLDDLEHIDQIYHLACPASPKHYQRDPVKTLQTCYLGTRNMLDLALRTGARLLFASTSEVYGNSLVCPQPETYFGNVNSYGPRACYDEGKRVAEALCYAYQTKYKAPVRIARIFNAYGPGMPASDGRVMSTFIHSAMNKKPMVITGDGSAIRCFQYVSDCVEGLVRLMESEYDKPVNIGSEEMISISELASKVAQVVGDMGFEILAEPVMYQDAVEDDPVKRQADCTLARRLLDWRPRVGLEEGILKTVKWFQTQ
ncbi:hypothetical protein BDV96DRAFT_495667, partial [Lophiotrema nucula]